MLPEFIPPMLAQLGEAFDSDDHLFEVKWDGTRAITYVEAGEYRIINRQRNVLTHKYPELQCLTELPDGTVLDGEIVVFVEGRPEFSGMLRREQARGKITIQTLSRSLPATYLIFDLLYRDGEPLLDEPLSTRRTLLRELLEAHPHPGLTFSDGVVGAGLAYFEQIVGEQLEGMVAKRLDSRYVPGKRSGYWIKVKHREQIPCAIIGFMPDGETALKSLVIGAEEGGDLVYVGRVGSGLDESMRASLNTELRARLRTEPIIPCPLKTALWVEPGLYCLVSYQERTVHGELRAPVFQEMISG